jgi:c(7)-type cytochrome triheme protein
MKILILMIVLVSSLTLVGSVLAVGPGKEITFPDGASGKVTFSGTIHADKGLKCADCHPKIFPMNKSVKITKADHVPGKYCGVCHNGTKAFDQTEKNCGKCHKK